MRLKLRRAIGTAAALIVLLAAGGARAQVATDGGAPLDAGFGVGIVVDGGAPEVAAAAATSIDAGAPAELPSVRASRIATMMLATPSTPEVEPPRPITRRLWFWMAITGVIVAGVLVGVAIHDPNRTRPECPTGYVCPP